jgi:hypothetical protein
MSTVQYINASLEGATHLRSVTLSLMEVVQPFRVVPAELMSALVLLVMDWATRVRPNIAVSKEYVCGQLAHGARVRIFIFRARVIFDRIQKCPVFGRHPCTRPPRTVPSPTHRHW